MTKTFNILIMMVTIALTGCSAKELYDAGKANRKQNCERLPISEREQCFKEINNKSYKEYERERKKTLEDGTITKLIK